MAANPMLAAVLDVCRKQQEIFNSPSEKCICQYTVIQNTVIMFLEADTFSCNNGLNTYSPFSKEEDGKN